MKEIFLRIGGRHAITLRAWLLLSPVSILGTSAFIPEGLTPGTPIWAGYLVGLIGHVVTGLALVPARLTYLSAKEGRPSRPFFAIATLATAGLARGFSVAWSLEAFELVNQADYLPRMIAGAIIVTIWFSVTAVLVGARRQFLVVYGRLRDSLERADALASEGGQQVAQVRDQLVEQVKTTLNEAFSSRKSTSDLHHIADTVISPLAQSLAAHQPEITKVEAPRRRISVGPILRTALNEFPFNPIPVAVISLVSTLYSRIWNLGVAGLIETLIQALVIVVIFSVAQRAGIRGWVVPLVWLVTGFLANLTSWTVLGNDFQDGFTSAIYLGTTLVLPAGFLSMLLAYDKEAERKLAQLEEALARVEWQERKLSQHLWIERKRLARYLHSDIQGRVRAAALSNPAGTMSHLQQLQRDCIAALELSRELPPFERFYADMVELWKGVASISLELEPEAMEAMALDSFGLASVVEIVREGIGNAVKHGKAKNIEVGLRYRERENPCLEVVVLNDGAPKTEPAVPGFGSQTLTEISASWGLEESDGKTKLWARVPVSSAQ